MFWKRYRYLLSVVCQALAWPVSAQFESVSFHRFNINDGLSQSSVFSIAQDSLGFVWLGTADGLNRFDGKQFKVFRNEPGNPNSIPDNFIRDLSYSKGHLIVLTSNQVTRFDGITETFQRIGFQDTTWQHRNNGFQKIHSDAQGNLWVGSWSGLFVLEANTDLLRKVDLTLDGLPITEAIQHVWGFGDSTLYLSLNSRIIAYEINSGEGSVFYEGVKNDSPRPLLIDQSDRFWVSLSHGRLRHRDMRHSDSRWIARSIALIETEGARVSFLHETEKEEFFAGTIGNGMVHFHFSQGLRAAYRHHVSDPKSLPADHITSIHQTGEGTYLLGTDAGGLAVSTLKKNAMSKLSSELPFPRNIHTGLIKSLFLDETHLWYGTMDKGLGRYDLSNGEVTSWPPSERLATFGIWSMARLNSNTKLLGGNGSLHFLDIRTGQIQNHFLDGSTRGMPRQGSPVHSLHVDGDRVWLGTRNGVFLFDLIQKRFVPLPASLGHGLTDITVFSATSDADHVYFGTYGSGLMKWNKNTGRSEWIAFNHLSGRQLYDNTIKSIVADASGRIWIGTASGIKMMDRKTGKTLHLTTEDGLSNNFIYGILPDDSGHVWASSNGGLSRIRKFITGTGSIRSIRTGFRPTPGISSAL